MLIESLEDFFMFQLDQCCEIGNIPTFLKEVSPTRSQVLDLLISKEIFVMRPEVLVVRRPNLPFLRLHHHAGLESLSFI